MAVEARWFIIHTYSGYENKVAENIEKIVENRKMQDKIFGVCIPLEKVVEVRDDKTVEVERKIFPGYVVVKLAVEYSDKEGEENVLKVPDETWHAIRYTRGVTGFVGPDGKPVPLTADEVKKLGLEKTDSEDGDISRVVTEVSYSEGDLVTITDGIMEGNSGVVEAIDTANNVVRVIVSFMGKEAPVELPLNQVKKAID
ncbi:MAG: transcription termination/antitermination factor NusG [Clostridia bacterium]|nr:transcription termination/antitermination factor NusG [Clostridia bacterium]MBQ6837558.1 transcription termination/antitermination factor NusG [Clostridia bacterium]